ncbi:hypothetical protein RRG08_042167 [Elysia crispata]|uniref:Uncharacterized protein n=1 Tax=Elysia crispata TaxID=231223 RepID=A0AAE0Z7J9_9GAST|nr:hypothetical protein RRG08_042167 [Elysia crispata]
MVINLPRHLKQVEKIVRGSDEWKDIMAITDVPTPKKIDGTDFGIFVDHPQKGLLLEYTKYRKAVQQRASLTVSKDMKSLMECLKALNRSGNLQLILKAPDDDRNRIRHIFRARVVNPMKNWVKREGNKAASGCYNKLWALRNFLKWLDESRPLFVSKHHLTNELKSLITNVSAALVPLRASKRMRTTSINKQIQQFGVVYSTAHKYMCLALLIKRFPRLLVCGLSFNQLMKHYKRILKTAQNKNTNDQLSHSVAIICQDQQTEIKPGDRASSSNLSPDQLEENEPTFSVGDNSQDRRSTPSPAPSTSTQSQAVEVHAQPLLTPTPSAARKRKYPQERYAANPVDEKMLETISNTGTRIAQKEVLDDGEHFCRCLVSKIKSLDPFSKLECQAEIQMVILRYMRRSVQGAEGRQTHTYRSSQGSDYDQYQYQTFDLGVHPTQ